MPANAHPKDRTKREHVAQFREVRWVNEDRTFCIIETKDGHSVHVNADPAAFVGGQVYRFLGRWEEGQRGPQFKAATFTRDEPASRAGVLKYLADNCTGVGTRLAERLWSAYGPAAVKTLRESPETVAADGYMSEAAAAEAAADLRQFAHLEATRVALFGLVAGRGFPGKIVDRAIAKWGAKAPAVVSANPFRLLTARLPGAGFKRCDKMFLDGGGRVASLKRQALAGWNVLREDRSGSTWVPAQRVIDGIVSAIPGQADPVRATKLAIRGGLLRIRREADGSKWVAAAEHARSEQRLADAVRRILACPGRWPAMLGCEGDGQPSRHQAEQILNATARAVGCFIGGGGTGKTYTLAAMLRVMVERSGSKCVAVCAPTGKAARRATEAMEANGLPLRATTVHQLLEIGRSGHDGGGWGFQRNRGNPLDQSFLIVDEASMLDTELAADLLDAVPPGRCVLLVGDAGQLSPVGHGAPLRDLLASECVSRGELTEVRRNAGGIVHAGRAIRDGDTVEFAGKFDLAAVPPANLRFLDCPPSKVLDTVEDVLRVGVPKLGFDPVWDTQILTATNEKSELSRVAANTRFAKALNPDGARYPGIPFAVGDKVICLKNGMLKQAHKWTHSSDPADTLASYRRSDVERYVANGDTGRVLAVGATGCVVEVADVPVMVTKGRPKADDAGEDGDAPAGGGGLGDWDHAYAITAHKSQGSEWPCVIVLADPAGYGVADRHWWYTAISRASKACLVIGDRAAFETQRRRESLVKRKTFLAELLADAEQSD
jgi:exodeoxyribonuclease V alpha subunit